MQPHQEHPSRGAKHHPNGTRLRRPWLPALLPLACLACLAHTAAAAEWSVPADLRGSVEGLTDLQRAFIESGDVLEIIPERQLKHELETRDPEDLARFVGDLMALADEMAYDPTRDMGAAPLNLKSKRFNAPMPTPAPLRSLDRKPGPFSVHRYLYPTSGVPTFAGAKVAIYAEDLIAGNVDVAIIGVPSNASSGRRDAGHGPDEMRALDTIGTPDIQSLVDPLDALSVVDYGNFYEDWQSTERTVEHVAGMVAETAATGAIPMLVGGDTSMLYPGVRGVAEAREGTRFGLLHFSAHPDAERYGDHTISDRQALFALLDQDIVAGRDVVEVGLRGPDVDADTLQWLRDRGVRYHTMAEMRQRGADRVLQRVLKEVRKGPDAFFVSIDVSVITPAEMIAAGRVTPEGLDIDAVAGAIRHVCASKDIVGFEITDMAPMLDLSRLSVLNANALLNACLVGIAVRRSGLDPDYVHPLALDHGQR